MKSAYFSRCSRSAARAVALGILLPLVSGACVSAEKFKAYEDEVLALRQERASLKKENRGLRRQLGQYEVDLAEANMMLLQTPDEVSYPELDSVGISYGERGGDIVFRVPNQITFASGKASLSGGGKDALKELASVLMRDYGSGTFSVEGHTDSDKISKSKFKSNRELSVARAMEVHTYLVEQCAVPDEQCIVAGFGEYQPIAENSTADGKAQNRRVEIVVR